MITPGTSSAIYTPPPPTQVAPMHPGTAKSVLKSIMTYVAVFGAVFVVSLTPVQSLLLRYIPNAYSGSGVVSLTGAACLGALGVVLVYVLQTFLQPLI
jgi:preprotein translocase subunit SecY